ncbi:hypothetical protein [Streptomyces sp. NPDC048419]|uniref:hypothetical protein n=1 Tax=Streptomyces sp. NPDC048419 TaxID=3365547 RepID=UPI0037243728
MGNDADSLKSFVANSTSATPEMKSAVADHVTKVDGISGSVNIQTNLPGDLTSSDANTGRLIVSAAVDWAKQAYAPTTSGAGLITVFNQSGALLADGNY